MPSARSATRHVPNPVARSTDLTLVDLVGGPVSAPPSVTRKMLDTAPMVSIWKVLNELLADPQVAPRVKYGLHPAVVSELTAQRKKAKQMQSKFEQLLLPDELPPRERT